MRNRTSYFWNTITKIPARTINTFTDTSIPIHLYIFSFFSILILRTIGEGYSQSYNYLNITSTIYYNTLIHTVLFYTSLMLALTCLFQFATREPLQKVARFILAGFIVVLLTPIIDLIVSPIHGANVTYLHPDMHLDTWYSYWTIFGKFSGISFGLRTEIFIALGSFFLYFRHHQLNPFKSIVFSWLAYSTIFFFAASPILLNKIYVYFNIAYKYNTELMILYFTLLNLIFGYGLYIANCRINKTTLFSGIGCFVKNLSFLAIGILICLYQAYTRNQSFSLPTLSPVHLFFLGVSVLFISFSALSEDNKPSPHTVPHNNLILAFIAICLTAITNINCLFVVVLYLLVDSQFIYTPLQLNRFPLISKLQFTINNALLILLGYVFLYSIIQSNQTMGMM